MTETFAHSFLSFKVKSRGGGFLVRALMEDLEGERDVLLSGLKTAGNVTSGANGLGVSVAGVVCINKRWKSFSW